MNNDDKQWTRVNLLLCGQHWILRLFLITNVAIQSTRVHVLLIGDQKVEKILGYFLKKRIAKH